MTVRPPLLGLSVGALAVLVAPLLVLGLFFLMIAPRGGGCEQRQVFAEAASPDGAWIARFYQNVCGGGLAGTDVSDTVEITRPDEAARPFGGVVFAMEDFYYDRPKPMALKWLNAREIEVTIPNDAWAGTQQSAFADLIISYRYLGDYPVERACLKQWRALPADETVRRSQSTTENLKAFLAKCEAELRPR